jgi:hypothetical protein
MVANQIGAGDIEVVGFTLTGARSSTSNHAVSVVHADKFALRSCRIVQNGSTAQPPSGTAVALEAGDCELEMDDCDISDNVGDSMVRVSEAFARIDECRFTHNIGKCVSVDQKDTGSAISIEGCEFTGNRDSGGGVGLDIIYSSQVEIRENLFLRNVAEGFPGGGVRIAASSGVIEFNVFLYDSCLAPGASGGGISWEGSVGQVRNNTFFGCYGYENGGAFQAFGGHILEFERNVIAHSAGGAAVQNYGPPIAPNDCNLYWSNFNGDFGDWTQSSTDIFADPLFCDMETLDFTVREDSPCVVGGCGQVGALGIGCVDISVDPKSWGRIKELYRLARQ